MRSNSRPSARAIERPSEVLPDPWWPDEREDRAARVRLELAHREELEDPVLDLLEAVVVLVEDLDRVLEIEVVLGRRVPRQRCDPLQVRADDAVLGGLRREVLQPAELAIDLLAHVVGQVQRGELLAQLVGLRRRLVELAELVLDRLELLAQDELALRTVHLGLHLVLDLRADRDDLELAREHLGEAAQPARDVRLLEQLLLLVGRQPQRAGDQVAQRARVLDVGDGDLQLLGQVRHGLDDLRERLLHAAHERGQLERLLDDVGQLGDLGDEVRDLALPAVDPHALGALHEQPQRPVGDLQHPRDDADDADLVEVRRARLLEVGLAAGDHDEHAIAGEHVVDELHRPLLADRQRRQRVGERHGLAQRQDRQRRRQLARDADLDLVCRAVADDVDHGSLPSGSCSSGAVVTEPPRSIGTLRARASTSASGSSTRRIPSW